ncbi:MAG: hypothetical protein AAGC46_15300 [Solirubrobacteraceae bacterium]|nr:hypothetical protein [Patulibacter sp.]
MRPPRFPLSLVLTSRRRRGAIVAAGAAVATLAGASTAQAACATTPVATVFASLGDLANYTLAPNGGFESGTTGWTLTGASVVAGNESTAIAAKADTKSLSISPTGVAVSPPFCVGIEHPSFRFVAKQASGTWATMLVAVRWKDSTGKVNTTTVGSVNGTKTWTVTASQMLATALPLWQAGQSVSAQLVFDPIDSGGGFQIDDVYVDPYRRS